MSGFRKYLIMYNNHIPHIDVTQWNQQGTNFHINITLPYFQYDEFQLCKLRQIVKKCSATGTNITNDGIG